MEQLEQKQEPANLPFFFGRHVLYKILDPSSDEDDVWGGKRD
jgi:hypothetical protein